MPAPVNALLVGWFGERNLGDEAMLEGLLALLERALGPVDATVLSGDPAHTTAVHGVRALPQPKPDRAGFRNLALVRAVLGADLVTLGGGDLIRESLDGPNAARDWLRRVRVPLTVGKPVALLGVSVGDLHRPETIAEVRDTLSRFRLVTGRDPHSVRRLEELGARSPVRIGDLALEAPGLAEVGAASRSRTGPPGERPVIGVAVRELVDRGSSLDPQAGERLAAELAEALDRVVATLDAKVALIPFRSRPGANRRDDDVRAGEALAGRARTGESWIRHPRPERAADFAALAATLDLVVGMRLHATVLGAAAGRPVLAIAYDAKVTGFLEDLGLEDQVLPLDANAGAIATAIERSLRDVDLPARIELGVEAARARTRALEPALAALVGRR